MHNEKLLRTALKYEVHHNVGVSLNIIGKFLFEKGLSDETDITPSTAMCFEESNPDINIVAELLNKLNYDL